MEGLIINYIVLFSIIKMYELHVIQTVETRGVQGRTVGDFVKTGGPNYNVWIGDHCITSAKSMTNLGEK